MRIIYKDLESLRDIKEPYRSALAILQDMYVEVPSKLRPIPERLPLYMAINAAQVICEEIMKNVIVYIPTIKSEIKKIFNGTNYRILKFDTFNVPTYTELGCIMGCVYYVLAVSGDFDEHHLNRLQQIVFNIDEKTIPGYFNVFKTEALRRRQEINNEKSRTLVEDNLTACDSKRIILSGNRNSDYTRIVMAMIHEGYFCHADNSPVNATEVGDMMLRLVGVGTVWKSMLQKAFSRDNPLKTFDNLRDAAQEYWQNRANIHN